MFRTHKFLRYLALAGLPCLLGALSMPAQGAALPGQVTAIAASVPRNWTFKGSPDIRTLALQPDQKILMGGRFSIPVEITLFEGVATFVDGGEEFDAAGFYRIDFCNLARLKADGTLDLGALSTARLDPDTGVLKVSITSPDEWEADPGFGIQQALFGAARIARSQGVQASALKYTFGPGMQTTGSGVHTAASVETIRVDMHPEGLGGVTGTSGDFRILVGGDFRIYGTASVNGGAEPMVPIRTRFLELDRQGALQVTVAEGAGPNANVRAMIPTRDATHDLLIGGDFTLYHNTAVGYGARLSPIAGGSFHDNVLEVAWSLNADARVNSILLPPLGGAAADDTMVYFAGEFNNIGATTRSKIVRVNEATGALDGGFVPPVFALPVPAPPNPPLMASVTCLAMGRAKGSADYSDIIAVGDFTTAGGAPRGHIARLAVGGALEDNWPADNTPAIQQGAGANGIIRTIVALPDGRYLIAGGFSQYNNIPVNGIARIEPDGRLDLTFQTSDLSCDGEFRTVATNYSGDPMASNVFGRYIVGGSFNRVTSAGRTGGPGIAGIQSGRLPVIQTQPAALNQVEVGGSATLSVVARDSYQWRYTIAPKYEILSESDPLYYQWQFKGNNIPNANDRTLVLNNVQKKNAGEYRVVVSNYVHASNAGVKATSNPSLVAVVNPFPRATKFEGVVRPTTAITNANLTLETGGTVSMKMNAYGSFTGALTLGASGRPTSYKFSGAFNKLGDTTVIIQRKNQLPLTLRLNFPVTFPEASPGASMSWHLPGPGVITATLEDTFGNSTGIDILNVPWGKTNPAYAFAGYYTVGLQSSVPADLTVANLSGEPAAPQGFGYATVSIRGNNGAVTIKGKLADGTAFSRKTYVWGSGSIPVHAFLYYSGGSVRGLMTVASPNITASLTWSRPQMPGSGVYPLGFGTGPIFSAQGAIDIAAAANSGLYAPLAPGAVTMTFDDINCTPAFGGLPVAPIVQPFTFAGRKATPSPLVADFSRAALKFNAKTGLFSGSAGLSADGRPLSYAGVIVTNGGVRWHGHFALPTNIATSPTLYGSVQGN